MKAPFTQSLLEPISAAEPSGKNIRYDPLIDSIREARSEEDDSLPMGNWERQTRRADYSLVVSLATDALQSRSKDLWLAAWLGEAWLNIEHYGGIAPALHLLLVLQQEFWASLYPEIEDNDLSLRAAPLHWGLDCYAALLRELPITANGITYAAYKAVRSGFSLMHNDEELTAERLDNAIAATPNPFYAGAEEQISLSIQELHALYLFCEEHYREEGPSFVKIRSTLDEIRHVIAQLLRSRQVHQLPSEPLAVAEKQSFSVPPAPESSTESVAESPPVMTSAFEPPVDPGSSGIPTSWDDAMSRVEACASYLLEQQPENPTCYLLAMALQYGRGTSTSRNVPPTEIRIALKQAREAGDWTDLLAQAVRALLNSSTNRWLDVHHQVWQAAENLGAAPLPSLVLAMVKAQLAENSVWPQESFEDDTPVASSDTQRWLHRKVTSQVAVSVGKTESAPPELELATEPDSKVTQARELAAQGEIERAVTLLMTSASTAQSGRDKFLLRMEVCRLCMQADQKHLAAHMLRHMLVEAERLHLEDWEGRMLPGTLLTMLLNAIKGDEADLEERTKLYASLCQIDPAQALAVQIPG